MSQLTARSLLASAAQVASGNGATVDIGSDTTLDLDLTITAIAGALATLTVIVETSRTGTGGWSEVVPTEWLEDADAATALKFVGATAVGAQFRVFPDCERYVRVSWTLSAGATATFAVTGSSVRVYAKTTDVPPLAVGCNCAHVSSRRLDQAIRAETDKSDTAFVMRGPVPFSTWDNYIRYGVATCAAVAIIVEDGMKKREEDEKLFAKCKTYDAWLDMVVDGKRRPVGAVDTTPTVEDGGAYGVSDTRRGW